MPRKFKILDFLATSGGSPFGYVELSRGQQQVLESLRVAEGNLLVPFHFKGTGKVSGNTLVSLLAPDVLGIDPSNTLIFRSYAEPEEEEKAAKSGIDVNSFHIYSPYSSSNLFKREKVTPPNSSHYLTQWKGQTCKAVHVYFPHYKRPKIERMGLDLIVIQNPLSIHSSLETKLFNYLRQHPETKLLVMGVGGYKKSSTTFYERLLESEKTGSSDKIVEVAVRPSTNKKCPRCWNYWIEPESKEPVCPRCSEVLEKLEEKERDNE